MKYDKKILVAVLIIAGWMPVFSQSYNVLPDEGRYELFHDYLLEELDEMMADRKIAVENALTSEENVLARQQEMRNKYLKILGDFPAKTPLNAVVVDTIETEYGYHIEKLHYQSVPGHHLTANFYIPDSGSAPYPAVLLLCGHYSEAKANRDYQNLCILFAKNGIAALIVDPICQGERYQITNADGDLSLVGESGTSAHSRLDVGSVLDGTSVVAYQLWDSHRSVDYLYSRDDVVDTSRIGCVGHSGGGAQSSYLMAYDERLKVGSVANYITNETSMFKESGPQTASQNLSFEGENGIDQPDYVAMFAPKPYMMIITTDNVDEIFKIDAARETRDEVQKFYDTLGVPEKLTLFETDDAHDYTKIKREATVRWFKRWFINDNDTVIEADQTTLIRDTLVVTSSGQVMTEFKNELNVTALNVRLADSLADRRTAFWSENSKEACLDTIKKLIRYSELSESPVYEAVENIERNGYTIEKGTITYQNHVPVTSLTFIPDNNTDRLPAILYVDGRGKDDDAGDFGLIEQVYIDSGYIVMSIDVRGFGETIDNASKNESKHNNNEHRNAVISLYLGKTLVGQRVEDIEKAMTVLCNRSDVDTTSIALVGIGRASVAVLHAAALDERFEKVVVRLAEQTPWQDAIADPDIKNQMTHEVPSGMMYYTITDLIEKGIAPREVTFAEEPEIEEPPEAINHLETGINNFQNYPNPFSDRSVINYTLDNEGVVRLEIYDDDGRMVEIINQSSQTTKIGQIEMNAQKFDPGIYVYKLYIDNNPVAVHKMIIIR
jgi:cephalosporin-C deacetylase-like acetyl esterase